MSDSDELDAWLDANAALLGITVATGMARRGTAASAHHARDGAARDGFSVAGRGRSGAGVPRMTDSHLAIRRRDRVRHRARRDHRDAGDRADAGTHRSPRHGAERVHRRHRGTRAARAAAKPAGPLAGVPFAVKNLIDIAGLPTLAGSKINREHPPARADATLVARLEAAGAILVGALNMGEYAYDFTGENSHDGPSRNPHDTTRMTGGSSGGSGGAVAGGSGADRTRFRHQWIDPRAFVVLRHLRTEADLRPAVARRQLSVRSSLDHLGPFARNTADLALAYDAMTGPDPHDPACTDRVDEPAGASLATGIAGLRIASAGGLFPRRRRPGSAGRAGQRRQGAWRDAADRIARSRAGARRGLCHHHIRRVPPCICIASAREHATSIPTCGTG